MATTEDGCLFSARGTIKDNMRHLVRLANLVSRNMRTIEDFDNCYDCIRAVLENGNSKRQLRNMDAFVDKLKEKINVSAKPFTA